MRLPALRRRLGRPRGVYVALALLAFCGVFAATAGVREALAARTQALRQTLDATPTLSRAITASTTWENVGNALSTQAPLRSSIILSEQQLTQVTGQLHADYNHGVVRLMPVSAAWASMSSTVNPVQGLLPGTGATAVKLEVSYRQPLGRHMRLVAGRFPAAIKYSLPRPPASGSGMVRSIEGGPTGLPFFHVLQVLVTKRTAARFGLRVGSKVKLQGPELATTGKNSTITLVVSGIVAPVDPSSAFWTADPAVAAPDLEGPPTAPYWVGGMITGPGEAAAMQFDFGPVQLAMQWTFPLDVGSVNGQQAQALAHALTKLAAQSPRLHSSLSRDDIAPIGQTLSTSSGLQAVIGKYLATAQAVDALLWLLYVSLTAVGLAVLLLAARMVAMRRSAELALIRARGASLWQVALATGRDAGLTCVPAALLAAGLAFLIIPGAGQAPGAGSWWPPAAVLAFAVCGPAVVAAWQHRLPRHRAAGRRPRGRARLVTEAFLVAAAVAGIIAFRDQGTPAGGGVNLYPAAAPVLVAIPAVVIVLRLYPLAVRGLLRASSRGSGAPAFLGLARAARSALNPALPAFALVMALTVAAFSGMVRDAVANGDAAASWQAAGADVRIAGSPRTPGFSVPPTAARAAAAVPGVTHAAQVWQATWVMPDGTSLTGLAVDPAGYAALVAATRGYPQVRAGLLRAATSPGAVQPVLASPQAATDLGHGTTKISTQAAVRALHVRVAGTLSGTPALPAGGAFIVLPLAALKSTATPSVPVTSNELLLTGQGIDRARLDAVLRQDFPPVPLATYRSAVLAQLRDAPLQHGAFVLLDLGIGVAAVLGLAVMLLELALGTAEREATLARLATMGLGEGQRSGVVALEVLPAVIAAGVAAWGCALALPKIVAQNIDLSVFTSTPITVPVAPGVSLSVTVPLAADVASVALPLAGLAVVTAITLGIEIRSGRRRRVTSLRIGE